LDIVARKPAGLQCARVGNAVLRLTLRSQFAEATMQASGSTSWDLRSMLGYPGLFVIFALFTLFWLAIILIPYANS
jgi:hypothetical protein